MRHGRSLWPPINGVVFRTRIAMAMYWSGLDAAVAAPADEGFAVLAPPCAAAGCHPGLAAATATARITVTYLINAPPGIVSAPYGDGRPPRPARARCGTAGINSSSWALIPESATDSALEGAEEDLGWHIGTADEQYNVAFEPFGGRG